MHPHLLVDVRSVVLLARDRVDPFDPPVRAQHHRRPLSSSIPVAERRRVDVSRRRAEPVDGSAPIVAVLDGPRRNERVERADDQRSQPADERHGVTDDTPCDRGWTEQAIVARNREDRRGGGHGSHYVWSRTNVSIACSRNRPEAILTPRRHARETVAPEAVGA